MRHGGPRTSGGLGWWWHTTDDTLDKIDRETLRPEEVRLGSAGYPIEAETAGPRYRGDVSVQADLSDQEVAPAILARALTQGRELLASLDAPLAQPQGS